MKTYQKMILQLKQVRGKKSKRLQEPQEAPKLGNSMEENKEMQRRGRRAGTSKMIS